jgi:hypothetical protein
LLIIERDHIVVIDPGCADFLPSRILNEYGLVLPESIEAVLLDSSNSWIKFTG